MCCKYYSSFFTDMRYLLKIQLRTISTNDVNALDMKPSIQNKYRFTSNICIIGNSAIAMIPVNILAIKNEPISLTIIIKSNDLL